MPSFRLFVDLDGVLADFDRGVYEATGRYPSQMSDREMWPLVAKTSGFYDRLPWMPDGRALWEFVARYSPIICTGLPRGNWAEPQKRQWCRRELGSEVPVVTCQSREKGQAIQEFLEANETAVLVDDRLKSQPSWVDLGGIFILHTSATESIRALRDLGLE